MVIRRSGCAFLTSVATKHFSRRGDLISWAELMPHESPLTDHSITDRRGYTENARK